MATMAETHANPTGSAPGVQPLRRLKETEASWDAKLGQARTQGESVLREARAQAEKALAQARQDAETLRATKLQEAAAHALQEAQRIVEQGKAEAARLGGVSASELEAKFSEVVKALFDDVKSAAPSPPPKK
jgi:vacuolar-type H+-ATPase subunit H